MEKELLFFNGINGDNGEYDIPPLTGEEFARVIQGEPAAGDLKELRYAYEQRVSSHFGITYGADPSKLDEAGWGVIFSAKDDLTPQIAEALQPLLQLRQKQAGDRFRMFRDAKGYRPGETKNDFLARQGAGPGPANPDKVPYYLLLVGSPEAIPFPFQTQLDVQYSVGRIFFDKVEGYANYAASVLAAESPDVRLGRRAAFFGVASPQDAATQLSCHDLVEPLVDTLSKSSDLPGWQATAYLGDQATKARLAGLLSGSAAPALLFSASHGMSFANGSSRQFPHQGALLCQDWPGPQKWGRQPIPPDFYFSRDDLSSDTNLLGMIAFFFACYGAGTPQMDQFSKQAFRERQAIAPRSFLAQLPTGMLGLPRGGALAVVGHIDRAWGYSFKATDAGRQTETFESALRALLSGKTLGAAMEYFNERYAEISTVLSDELEEIEFGKRYDPYSLVRLWTTNNDARGYAILGDPAVRLPVTPPGDPASERPAVISTRSAPPAEGGPTVKATPAEVGPAVKTPPAQGSGQIAADAGQTVQVTATAPVTSGAAESYSLFGPSATDVSLADTMKDVARDIQDFSHRLMRTLNQTVDEASATTVQTYQGDTLIATTRVHPDGDVEVVLHIKPGELDPNVLALHSQMVLQARAGQAEMLKAMAAVVGSLAGLIRPT